MKVFFIFVCVVTFTCKSYANFPISNQNAVYETVFSTVTGDATRKIQISNSTKVDRLSKKLLDAKNLSNFEGINNKEVFVAESLIEELQVLNKSKGSISWKPILVTAVFGDYKYPDIHYQVSKVAFSKKGNSALVFMAYHCVLCGYSVLFNLELIGNRWVILGYKKLSVS